jgi:hypothetical protein
MGCVITGSWTASSIFLVFDCGIKSGLSFPLTVLDLLLFDEFVRFAPVLFDKLEFELLGVRVILVFCAWLAVFDLLGLILVLGGSWDWLLAIGFLFTFGLLTVFLPKDWENWLVAFAGFPLISVLLDDAEFVGLTRGDDLISDLVEAFESPRDTLASDFDEELESVLETFKSDFAEELESTLAAFRSDFVEVLDSFFEALVFNEGLPLLGSLTLN